VAQPAFLFRTTAAPIQDGRTAAQPYPLTVLSGHTRFRINIPGVAENGQPYAYWTSKVSIRCAARHPTRRYTVVLHGSDGALVDAGFPQYRGWTLLYPGTLSGYEFDFMCPARPL
jgi:hypothetical protein